MSDDGLGAAMSLAGARDDARDAAVGRVVAAAKATAAAIREGAAGLGDPHDRTAAINGAMAWDFFAQALSPKAAPVAVAKPYRSSDDDTRDDDAGGGFGSAGSFGGFGDGFGGGGGDFGGGGASGGW